MNSKDAQRILLLYRPGTSDSQDPEIAQALALTETDAGLREWFEQHKVFQEQVRQKLREVSVPTDLKDRILAERKVVPLRRFQYSPALLSAAALVLLLGVLGFLFLQESKPDKFADYRGRMVRSAQRNYRMDILTTDPEQVRQYVADKGGPADYSIPAALKKLPVTGGGLLRWRGNPVSMVCFDRGQKQMVFLFVIDSAAIKDPPTAENLELTEVNHLPTASWTVKNRTYMLAGEDAPDKLKKYLN